MATNFEFYKEKILAIVEKDNSIALSNGKPVDCSTVGCDICGFRGNCYKNRYNWLYAEHIEPSKLTKRERAFCEAVQTGWIARDKDRSLYWFPDDVEIQKTERMWNAERYVCIYSFKLLFLCIKWEDEKPWSVADLLKLEVQDDA